MKNKRFTNTRVLAVCILCTVLTFIAVSSGFVTSIYGNFKLADSVVDSYILSTIADIQNRTSPSIRGFAEQSQQQIPQVETTFIDLSTVKRDLQVDKISKTNLNFSNFSPQTIVALEPLLQIDEQDYPIANQMDIANVQNFNFKIDAKDGWTYVEGHLWFEVSKNGAMQPLKYTKIELRDAEPLGLSWVMGSTYTDVNGGFSFAFNNQDQFFDFENGGYDLFIRWYPQSYSLKVGPLFSGVVDYGYQSHKVDNVSTGSTTNYDYYVPYDDSDASKAFYGQQGMIVGQSFARYKNAMPDSVMLRVIYPFTFGGSFCYVNMQFQSLVDLLEYLLLPMMGILPPFTLLLPLLIPALDLNDVDGLSGIESDDFDQWDTLSHEYGHFVQGINDIYGSSIWDTFKYDPNHSDKTDHFEDKYIQGDPNSKKFAMNLTWSESWATAVAFVAQDYYKTGYINIPNANGPIYDNPEKESLDIDYEKETYNSAYQPTKGEAQERAVTAFLWDLYDDTTENNDNIQLGESNWWSMTTQKGTFTLTDFVNNLGSSYRSQIGQILSLHQIAPSQPRVDNFDNVNIDVPPQLQWTANGSQNNPNDKFKIAYYDKDGKLLYESNYIRLPLGATNSYRFDYLVPSSEWQQVINKLDPLDGTVNISIKGYNTKKQPTSGGYMSGYASIVLYQNNAVYLDPDDTFETSF